MLIFDRFHIYITKLSVVLCSCISLYEQAPSFLGGLGMELAFYPLLLGIMIWLVGCLILDDRIYWPRRKSFYLLCLFLVWLMITGIVNIANITDSVFKGVTGSNRFITQYGTMLFYWLSTLYIYNGFRKIRSYEQNTLRVWENLIVFSAYVLGLYSFLEITSVLGQQSLREIVNFIDGVFRSQEVTGDVFAYVRIRSLTAEASYFGMYCGVAIPWLIVHAIKCTDNTATKIFNVIFVLYYFVLLVFSLSRTAYFMLAIELIFMVFIYRHYIARRWIKFFSYGVLILLLLMFALLYFISIADVVDIDILSVFLSFTSGNEGSHDLSNIARIGSQWAGFYMFLDNPFFGVGYGQYPYYYVQYVPSWAWISIEVQIWGSNVIGSLMAPCHGLYARLLGETGFVGLIIWISILCCMCKEIYEVARRDSDIRVRCCLVTLLAISLFGFNFDGFRVFYYWIFFGLIWTLRAQYAGGDHIE